jgi:hypothetical protein
MRIPLIGLTLVLVAGCASQSEKAAPAAAPAAAATAAPIAVAPVAAATAAPNAAPATAGAPKTIQEARMAGYKIVNEKGKTLYCRDQLKTGSHVRQETICLTKEELDAAREASKRNMDQMMRAVPPPQGT